MAPSSWFNSSDQVDTALMWVAVIGAVIEVGVAVAAVINVHREFGKPFKDKLEKHIEIFACVAAFFFMAEAILGWRSSKLLGKELEVIRKANIELEAKQQPRRITMEQLTNFIFLTEKIQQKIPIRVAIGAFHDESCSYAYQIRDMFNQAGFRCPDSDTNFLWGIHTDPTAMTAHRIGFTNEWRDLEFFTDITNNLDAVPFQFEKTNGFARPVIPGNDTNRIYAGLIFALTQVGISLHWDYMPVWVAPNHCEVYINQRPY